MMAWLCCLDRRHELCVWELLGKHLLEALRGRWWEVITKLEHGEIGCEAENGCNWLRTVTCDRLGY
jgi:hypothetical protein